jgi:hypothetical protein
VLSGATSNTINVQFDPAYAGGTLSVTAGNGCGISAARTKVLYVNTPATPSIISGPAAGVCQSTQTYSVTAVSGITYNWTVPVTASIISGQGTNSIVVSFNPNFLTGSIGVKAQNGCGISGLRSKTVKAIASNVPAINGPTSLCTNLGGNTFSVVPDPFITSYVWTPPGGSVIQSGQGTAAISMKTGLVAKTANISVKGVNACGTTAYTFLSLTISACPKAGEFVMNGNDALSLYPNPAHDQVDVIFNTDNNKTTSLRLLNILGQVKSEQSFVPEVGQNTIKVNLRKLPAGVYMMSLDQDGHTYSQRLVIQ